MLEEGSGGAVGEGGGAVGAEAGEEDGAGAEARGDGLEDAGREDAGITGDLGGGLELKSHTEPTSCKNALSPDQERDADDGRSRVMRRPEGLIPR